MFKELNTKEKKVSTKLMINLHQLLEISTNVFYVEDVLQHVKMFKILEQLIVQIEVLNLVFRLHVTKV